MSSKLITQEKSTETKKSPSISDLIKPKELLEELGVGRTTLWKWQKEGRFPAPVMAGTMKLGWIREEVDALIFSKQILS